MGNSWWEKGRTVHLKAPVDGLELETTSDDALPFEEESSFTDWFSSAAAVGQAMGCAPNLEALGSCNSQKRQCFWQ